jgi:hypothetical protein
VKKDTTTVVTKDRRSSVENIAAAILDEVQGVVEATEQHIELAVAPVRKNILKRFPILFILAVTFGITATMTGMEQILIQHDLLADHPGVITFIGVGILILTGTVYKKLG